MAKFCGNCGMRCDDDDRVCGNCGTQLEVSKRRTPSGTKYKKWVTIVAVLCVALAVAVTAFHIVWSYTGYRGVVRKTVRAFEKYDMNTLNSLASNFAYLGSDATDDDVFSSQVSDKLDELEGKVGHDVKINYEITDAYELPERKLDQFLKNMETYEYDTSGVQKVLQTTIKYRVKGARSSISYTDDILLLIKTDDGWRILYGGI